MRDALCSGWSCCNLLADRLCDSSLTAIETVRKAAAGKFLVGAQNMHWADWGPYTGEISAPMLQELGVELVALGHAERREFYNETDADVNRKIHTAYRFGLRPLLCIGEEAKDRDFGVEHETIARQLRIALHDVPSQFVSQMMIAYEPCWAIGDGGTTADRDTFGISFWFCARSWETS